MQSATKQKVTKSAKEMTRRVQKWIESCSKHEELKNVPWNELSRAIKKVEKEIIYALHDDSSSDESGTTNESFTFKMEDDMDISESMNLYFDFDKFMDDQLLREGKDLKRKQDYFNAESPNRDYRAKRADHVLRKIKV